MYKTTKMLILALIVTSCGGGKTTEKKSPEGKAVNTSEVRLITVDPGHFHAALVQKEMYPGVDSTVMVYAPEGVDLDGHLKRVELFNTRKESPTAWNEKVYTGADYFEKMLAERAGNVVILSGNNRIKTSYIKKSVEAGLNVLADKPMVITPENYPLLEESLKMAAEKGLLLYDIMTERYEITSMLQRELSKVPVLFGTLQNGTPEVPSVEKVSVHHYYKNVAGLPLVRPAWFFDINQQGEGIVDVTTHLVDLVQWGCFPEQIILKSDIEMLKAKHWTTVISPEDFKVVTNLDQYPEYLKNDIKDGKLNVYANGEMIYKIKGVCAKVSVTWNFKAPEGTGDTHYSIMRGSKCALEIRQGAEEKYAPTLYVRANAGSDLGLMDTELKKITVQNPNFSGLDYEKISNDTWKVKIPDSYKVGHEAHFSQVTAKYLEYLKAGKLPDWEVPNMIAKYYTTMEALKMARK